jgi:uncharacterized membrane protein YgdD (TMEM256/DUF423 family)
MTRISRQWIAVGAALAALGVAFGAFGAHLLPGILEKLGHQGDDLSHRIDIFETAVRYQMFHAMALVFVGLALQVRDIRPWRVAAWAFLIGIALFSGLLKVLTFAGDDWKWLGAVVPFGGVAMIVGWIAVAVGALRK